MRWRFTQWALAVLMLSFLSCTLLLSIGAIPSVYGFGVGVTPLNASFACMISFIAWLVCRFAAVQFRDEQEGRRFHHYFVTTVLAILLTAMADHLALFWLGWLSVSLTLHRLLVFYPERPRAQLAAHKKFIFARVAELLLAAALLILWLGYDLSHLSQLTASDASQISPWVSVLLVTVAAIKCAQLPVHGWLLQVVEAPTPVSALLHAGIINLGGYLLLQTAPLLAAAESARVLLALVAGVSMLVATTVTMTRISIKVRLAWSTVAQMALMLVEISLGLYSLALLHLFAHSCYKAYAFLASGSVVEQMQRQRYAQLQRPHLRTLLLGFLIAVTLVVSVIMLGYGRPMAHFYFAPWLAITLALGLWLASEFSRLAVPQCVRTLLQAGCWLALYVLGKAMTANVVVQLPASDYLVALDAWVTAILLSITLVYLWLLYRPQQALGHRVFVALNAGLYLDEWATRLTLRLWPLRSLKGVTA